MTTPVTNHTVVLYINGVIKTSLLKADSLYIRHSLTNDVAVADFTILGDSYTPTGWDDVTIIVDGVIVFGGFITNKSAVTVGSGSTKQTNWQVQCKDWSVLLDIVVISEKYTQQPDYLIIDDIFDTYLSTEGFTYGASVAAVKNDIDISFDKVTIRQALNQLADIAGATWYMGPDKLLYWNSNTGFGSGAFNIDTDAPNDSTTFDVAFGSIARTVDESQIVNKVTVYGGESASGTKQTDTFAANGTKFSFGPLTQSVSAMWSVTYTIGAVTDTVYATNIGYAPYGTLAADGGSYIVLVDLSTGTLKVKNDRGDVPDNGTNVVVSYYTSTPVETVVQDSASQTAYGRVFHRKIYDETITSAEAATNYAQRVLDQYATARETVTFTSYRHGLLPGALITIRCDKLGLTSPPATYMIQEVEIHPVMSRTNEFLIVARVTCGDKQHTILDVIRQASATGSSNGAGVTPVSPYNGNLSNISGNLGEVVSGRALFTDGGTAQFSWANYGGHTGAVVGLEDINAHTYGALYILDAGTIQAKLGRMTGLPNVGTVTPTGWGLYTTNGYFKGIVAAGTVTGNQISGGTITGVSITGNTITGGTITGGYITGGSVVGGYISGGTINGAVGNIGGFVIAANQLYSNGGTISTGSVVNSSNPGVYIGTAGLFGFGTLGLTFALYSDPAKSPWFSSGTINNVVYEVYESGIIRTNADVFASGGVQIDNSGIFGVNPTTGGVRLLTEDGGFLLTEDGRTIAASGVTFMVDATTGNLWAENAFLSGTVYATTGVFNGTVYASDGSFTGTVSAASVVGGTISGALVSGGTVSGGTVTGAYINGGSASFAGGSINFDVTQGIDFIVADWVSIGTVPSYIRWKNNAGRTYGYIGMRYDTDTTTTSFDLKTATSGGEDDGQINMQSQKWTSNVLTSYGAMRIYPGACSFIASGTLVFPGGSFASDQLTVYSGSVTAVNMIPRDTNAHALGTTTNAWKALYLHDGTDEWKITINTSGVLQTVKV